MLPPFLPPIAVQLLNALLARENWARERLRPHAGKTVRLTLGAFDLALAIAPGGGVHGARNAPPNVTVTVAAGDLPRLLGADAQQRMQAVHIAGEAALAHAVSDLARDLRWDVEEDLAGLIGDIPAGIMTRTLRALATAARETGSRLGQNVIEYATYETELLPSRQDLRTLTHDIHALDAAADTLNERLAALERSVGAS